MTRKNPLLGKFHFSVDDVYASCIEAVTLGPMASLFEQPFFRFIQGLHKEFACDIDLYLFSSGERVDSETGLNRFFERFGSELAENQWLGIGPHAQSYAEPPYQASRFDIRRWLMGFERLSGVADSVRRAKFVRLHYFSELYDTADLLRECGVQGLFLTDKPAVSYHLPPAQRSLLAAKGHVRYAGLDLFRSHLRVEDFASGACSQEKFRNDLERAVATQGYFSLFSHECDLADPQCQLMAVDLLADIQAAGLSGYQSAGAS